jgi:hypothetical protein
MLRGTAQLWSLLRWLTAGVRFAPHNVTWDRVKDAFHSRGYSLRPPDDEVAAVAVVAVASGPP